MLHVTLLTHIRSDTCEYDDSGYKPNSNQISTKTGVTALKDCAEICRNESNCRYFVYTDTSNGNWK